MFLPRYWTKHGKTKTVFDQKTFTSTVKSASGDFIGSGLLTASGSVSLASQGKPPVRHCTRGLDHVRPSVKS